MKQKLYLIDLLCIKFKSQSPHDYKHIEMFLDYFHNNIHTANLTTISNFKENNIFLGKTIEEHEKNKELLYHFISKHNHEFIFSIAKLAEERYQEYSANIQQFTILRLKNEVKANFYLDMKNYFTVVAEYKKLDDKLNHSDKLEEKKTNKI